jgi:uncharacterized protein YerC
MKCLIFKATKSLVVDPSLIKGSLVNAFQAVQFDPVTHVPRVVGIVATQNELLAFLDAISTFSSVPIVGNRWTATGSRVTCLPNEITTVADWIASVPVVCAGSFEGRITDISNGVAVQKISREGVCVRHEIARLSGSVSKDDVHGIKYGADGVGMVTGKKRETMER